MERDFFEQIKALSDILTALEGQKPSFSNVKTQRFVVNSSGNARFSGGKTRDVLKVKFLTNTDAVLDSKSYTLYEYVSPNGSKDFQIKVVSPSGTKKISAEIFKASADK